MAIVQNVVCDGCGVTLPSVAMTHTLTVQYGTTDGPRVVHFGMELCDCGQQVREFLTDLIDRRGVAVNPGLD